MARNIEISQGEWYHIYNRGIDKRIVFDTEKDARRFMETLYLANNVDSFTRDDIGELNVYSRDRKETLVDIVAYALMPNHFHLIVYEKTENGISTFMQKLGTAYTMYYNTRYKRTGNLFNKPFRAKHITDDTYLQHVVGYVHLNPAERKEPGFKKGKVHDRAELVSYLETYEFSSLQDYRGSNRPERAILDSVTSKTIQNIRTTKLLDYAVGYYKEFAESEN